MEAVRAMAAIPQVSLPMNGERCFSSVGAGDNTATGVRDE